MSLDLSSALRDAAEHAPLGTLEPVALRRRIRRRRAARTGRTDHGRPGARRRDRRRRRRRPQGSWTVVTRTGRADDDALPPDQVAQSCPRPTRRPPRASAAGPCSTRPRRRRTTSGSRSGSTRSRRTWSMPVNVSVRFADGGRRAGPRSAGGCPTTGSSSPWRPTRSSGAMRAGAGVDVRLAPGSVSLTCGGADVLKALPDGDYAVYAVVTRPRRPASSVALSPAEPLVVAGAPGSRGAAPTRP